MSTNVVGVGDALLLVIGLEGIAPNPVVPGSHIRYALRSGADVQFDVLDASGRRVSWIAEGSRTAGHWTATWSGAGDDGRRLSAGMYFLRMLVDGRMVEGSKIVLLP